MIWAAYIALIFSLIIGLGALFGAPYLPILSNQRRALLEAADFRAGQTVLDLGSGDGAMLVEVARRGGEAIGIEINPFWWLVSVIRTWPYRQHVRVYLANFWLVEWPEADIIYVFIITRYTHKMAQALAERVRTQTTVASYGFALPEVPAAKQVGATYIYDYPTAAGKVARKR